MQHDSPTEHDVKVISAIVVGCLTAGAAFGQDTRHTFDLPDGRLTVISGPAPPLPYQGRPDFDALDRNGDGRLSLEEAASHRLLHSDFLFYDRNRDGYISRAELARWR